MSQVNSVGKEERRGRGRPPKTPRTIIPLSSLSPTDIAKSYVEAVEAMDMSLFNVEKKTTRSSSLKKSTSVSSSSVNASKGRVSPDTTDFRKETRGRLRKNVKFSPDLINQPGNLNKKLGVRPRGRPRLYPVTPQNGPESPGTPPKEDSDSNSPSTSTSETIGSSNKIKVKKLNIVEMMTLKRPSLSSDSGSGYSSASDYDGDYEVTPKNSITLIAPWNFDSCQILRRPPKSSTKVPEEEPQNKRLPETVELRPETVELRPETVETLTV